MFIAEKMRALCQQMAEYGPVVHRSRPTAARAKDFVDIYVLAKKYGVDFTSEEFRRTLTNVFEKKRVPLSLLGRIRDEKEHHKANFQSVRDTIAADFDLQDFDFYFDFTCSQCEKLKPFWNE